MSINKGWIRNKDFPGENDNPFWVTLEDEQKDRRIELVVNTYGDGICYTNDVSGESYADTVTEKIISWRALIVPCNPDSYRG